MERGILMTMSFNNHNNKESIPSEMLSTKWVFDNHNNKESIPSEMLSTKWAFESHNNRESIKSIRNVINKLSFW